jgi:hypothetical protein
MNYAQPGNNVAVSKRDGVCGTPARMASVIGRNCGKMIDCRLDEGAGLKSTGSTVAFESSALDTVAGTTHRNRLPPDTACIHGPVDDAAFDFDSYLRFVGCSAPPSPEPAATRFSTRHPWLLAHVCWLSIDRFGELYGAAHALGSRCGLPPPPPHRNWTLTFQNRTAPTGSGLITRRLSVVG